MEPYGQTDATRNLRGVAKTILGKIYKGIKPFINAVEAGAYEGLGFYNTASDLTMTYQQTVILEFECDCEGVFTGGAEWEESKSWSAIDFDNFDEDEHAGNNGFGPRRPLPSPAVLRKALYEHYVRSVIAALKECEDICKK